MKKNRFEEFDRFLIDWADEAIQDLVASFSARRPTTSLRFVVVGFYLFAVLHLLFVALLPFDRDAIARGLGGPAWATQVQVTALATGIVVGGISFHLLMLISYIILSFLVRAAKPWTRALGTVVLISNAAVALNGLRGLQIVGVFVVVNAAFLALTPILIGLLWYSSGAFSQARSLPQRSTHMSRASR